MQQTWVLGCFSPYTSTACAKHGLFSRIRAVGAEPYARIVADGQGRALGTLLMSVRQTLLEHLSLLFMENGVQRFEILTLEAVFPHKPVCADVAAWAARGSV